MRWPMMRAMMSAGPPAGNGTTMRMARLGNCAASSCAVAGAAVSMASRAMAIALRICVMFVSQRSGIDVGGIVAKMAWRRHGVPSTMQVMPMTVKALFFDVFGTLVDWRTSVAREAAAVLKPLGHDRDWIAFADAWRGEYQPGMEEVRTGKIPFSKLDVLHRRNLERMLPRFGLTGLSEDVLRNLN